MHSLLTPVRKHVQLRSSSSGLYFVPKVNNSIGTRAFVVGAPTLAWKKLPASVKLVENILPSFKDIPLQPCLTAIAPWRINQSDDN